MVDAELDMALTLCDMIDTATAILEFKMMLKVLGDLSSAFCGLRISMGVGATAYTLPVYLLPGAAGHNHPSLGFQGL